MPTVGFRSDRNPNPCLHTFAQGNNGSLILLPWLGFALISILYLRMLARCLIIRVHLSWSRRCARIDPPTQHLSTLHTVPIRSMAKARDYLFMCPQERFSLYKLSCQAYPLIKRIGPLAAPQRYLLCLLLSYCCLYRKPLKSYLSVLAVIPCLKNHLSIPFAPRWVRHSYLSKMLQ